MTKPFNFKLWEQARREFPHDRNRRQAPAGGSVILLYVVGAVAFVVVERWLWRKSNEAYDEAQRILRGEAQ